MAKFKLRLRSIKSSKAKDASDQIFIKGKYIKPKFIKPANFAELPRLQHGLERVLFNPGVHFLRCPRSGVYNYDSYLENITQPENFRYDKLPAFTPPSKDMTLANIAKENDLKFIGSTSSVTALLSHLYFSISGLTEIPMDSLPTEFKDSPSKFTRITRSANAILCKPNENGIYSIDKYEFNVPKRSSIMMDQGKSLEAFFTMPKKDYSLLLKNEKDLNGAFNSEDRDIVSKELCEPAGVYSYCQLGSLLIRSQLDCFNPKLPFQSFDIKTRATVAIRWNANCHREFINYKITNIMKLYKSFTREIYDMSRSALLKYMFQVRLGNMDGLFISYHNTENIFGFQYMPREEIDDALFGGGDKGFGDKIFRVCLKVFNQILYDVSTEFNGSPFSLLVRSHYHKIEVYAERLNADDFKSDEEIKPKQEFVGKWTYSIKKLINGLTMVNLDLSKFNEDDEFDIVISKTTDLYSEAAFNEYSTLRSSVILSAKKSCEVDDKAVERNKRLFLKDY